MSTQRIYVHNEIAEDFTQQPIARVEKLRTADATLKGTEVGPLIQPREADRVSTHAKIILQFSAPGY